MVHSIRDLHIEIPEELIAQYPLEERDASRLLVYDLKNRSSIDDYFKNLPQYISGNDCLIYNDARVINARLYGYKNQTGALLEILLTRRIDERDWLCLISPARRVKEGIVIAIDKKLSFTVLNSTGEGSFKVRFNKSLNFNELKDIGEVPLPKYIKRKPIKGLDNVRYQTIFADKDGAIASPTAGLHFTERIVREIRDKGAVFVPITLYVDWGTFKPVRERDYRKHKIHSEVYEISEESACIINTCIEEKRRIVCIGTTSVRALETAIRTDGSVRSGSDETDLYIYPGFIFKSVDGIITNFHMLNSTLILLVSAFAGEREIEKAYNHAVSKRYRFFSYGDAMFLMKK